MLDHLITQNQVELGIPVCERRNVDLLKRGVDELGTVHAFPETHCLFRGSIANRRSKPGTIRTNGEQWQPISATVLLVRQKALANTKDM